MSAPATEPNNESTRIQAAVFDGNGTISIEHIDLAAPGPGEVRVKIAAAGVCHSDLHVTTGAWDVPAPVVLGHEGSGVVSAVGSGVDDLEPGDHVVLSWVPGCGECRACQAGRPAQCSLVASVVAPGGTLYDGTTRLSNEHGTIHHYLGVSSFAEEVVVPRSGAIKVRKDAPLEDIAIVGCAIATGVGAVRNTAGVQPGSTVAVIGCGGVGLACVQGARLAGASRIVAVDVVAEKLSLARKLGATDVVDASTSDDVVAALREVVADGDDAGYDYVFDAIGKIVTTEQAIAALGLGGAAVIVGLPPQGERASFEPLALAEADQRILGSNYGSAVPERDIPALVDEVMAGNLDLASMISGRRPLAEAAAALDDLAAGHALRQLLIPSA
ncbi:MULTISPECIES: Zn-dependent alcohol dehydrogenase [unclassified Mycolicibacterium]|uniref:Zn-dependent alcohol dehydrogenase n=1 Tax=unclassified Mycolicibacterium TaxID=2636767 RepID=UPI001306FD7A|nr:MULTISPECIES: Zn-dependent alcohol dehydrogenase [unclassified Mycolicibacterium]MUL81605.1 Zn-dependent alcohol dehydrogenase [Mycolicibacterium sp. CBMA 329]MUL87371.1 Zn-dependent alcohol dehydrogenase [Mycolicibacterium sp. CBMA 331]MUL99763.1 Zn-dependent alcohol dehydrogenase [Mycolicibacterium sp. CBMA 334]MUM25327.1 Zn-dependent alcohol dehydrogenase [Mycolicibacterium sp. CBMA 295]MUM37668.1 Zn-dependent alcohol dehydrogenase [Mycolicibacterium sp. CBMA 247]